MLAGPVLVLVLAMLSTGVTLRVREYRKRSKPTTAWGEPVFARIEALERIAASRPQEVIPASSVIKRTLTALRASQYDTYLSPNEHRYLANPSNSRFAIGSNYR